MSIDFLGEVAINHSRQTFDAARKEASDPNFRDTFRAGFDQLTLVRVAEKNFPPASVTRLTREEGSSGIIPAGARPTILRSVLAGEPIPPLRVSYTEQSGPEDHRLVNRANVHLLIEVGVADMMNKDRLRAVLSTFEAMRGRVGARNIVIPDPKKDAADVLIRELEVKLQLIQRSGLGEYQFLTYDLKTGQDIDQAIKGYQAALSGAKSATASSPQTEEDILFALFNTPPITTENDATAYDWVNGQLTEQVKSSPSDLNLAVVLEPTQFAHVRGRYLYGDFKRTPTYKLLGEAAFLLVPNKGLPKVVRYNIQNRELREIGGG